MSKRFPLLDWIEYLPRGLRKAWCELTGGHDNTLGSAAKAGQRADHIYLHCNRCGRDTRWYEVPVAPTLDEEIEEAEAEEAAQPIPFPRLVP